jgi:hypothetical protein
LFGLPQGADFLSTRRGLAVREGAKEIQYTVNNRHPCTDVGIAAARYKNKNGTPERSIWVSPSVDQIFKFLGEFEASVDGISNETFRSGADVRSERSELAIMLSIA